MASQRTPQEIIALIHEVIEDVPDFSKSTIMGDREYRWRGRVEAILGEAGLTKPLSDFRAALVKLNSNAFNPSTLITPLHAACATLELDYSQHADDSYIVGNGAYKGYSAVVTVLKIPCDDLFVVDPHMDIGLFLELAPQAVAKRPIRCLTSMQKVQSMKSAYEKWINSGDNQRRPISFRIAPKGLLHDQFLILDHRDVRRISHSLRDATPHPYASITRVTPDLARMKIDHYEKQWSDASAL